MFAAPLVGAPGRGPIAPAALTFMASPLRMFPSGSLKTGAAAVRKNIVAGLVPRPADADDLAESLAEAGFSRDEISTIPHLGEAEQVGQTAAPGFPGNLKQELLDMGLPEPRAQQIEDGIRRGGAAVVVRVDDADLSRARDIVSEYETSLEHLPPPPVAAPPREKKFEAVGKLESADVEPQEFSQLTGAVEQSTEAAEMEI